MQVTADFIMSLGPCAAYPRARVEQFVADAERTSLVDALVALPRSDALWFVSRALTPALCAQWASHSAERARGYAADADAARYAARYATVYARYASASAAGDARYAADAARYAAGDAVYAADAARYAAGDAVYAARYAADAARYAADAARYAADAARYAADAAAAEHRLAIEDGVRLLETITT